MGASAEVSLEGEKRVGTEPVQNLSQGLPGGGQLVVRTEQKSADDEEGRTTRLEDTPAESFHLPCQGVVVDRQGDGSMTGGNRRRRVA